MIATRAHRSLAVDHSPKGQLVAALRMLESIGIIDFNGHASIRTRTGFLINSGQSIRSRLTSDDIVEVDGEGNLVSGSSEPPMEFPIHAEIYRRRPDVSALIHAHPKWSTFLSMTSRAYEPVFPQGALIGDPAVFPDVLSVNTRERGEALAASLGDRHAVILKSHGTVVAAADIVTCFALTVYLEENAYRQYMAAQIGAAYALSAAEVSASQRNLWKPSLFRKAWDYYAAKEDSE